MPLLKLHAASLRSISERAACNVARVEFLIEAYNNQIKDLDPMVAFAEIGKLLPQVAAQYGARQTLDSNILRECQALIFEKFKHLSVKEIREAYRQWAAGEFEISGGEMYGGIFNVIQLGKVISGYSKRRKKILATILNETANRQIETERAARESKMKESFETDFVTTFKKKKSEIQNWEEVPVWWWDVFKRRKWIQYDKQTALDIYEKAKTIAEERELKTLADNRVNRAKNRFDLVRVVDGRSLAQNIAGQMMVYKYAIQNPDFIIQKNIQK